MLGACARRISTNKPRWSQTFNVYISHVGVLSRDIHASNAVWEVAVPELGLEAQLGSRNW